MKSFFLSLTMTLFPFFASAQSFDALWKAEQKLEADGVTLRPYLQVYEDLRALPAGQSLLLSRRRKSRRRRSHRRRKLRHPSRF